ncbi:serine protease [Dactylosporangium sp. NPDC049525]|uniref:trypsin-like serine peptidase n=1 Tax=Dactylosporangium sp. NPDC049525 TaxID=3154730 RepID=UPI00342ABDB6
MKLRADDRRPLTECHGEWSVPGAWERPDAVVGGRGSGGNDSDSGGIGPGRRHPGSPSRGLPEPVRQRVGVRTTVDRFIPEGVTGSTMAVSFPGATYVKVHFGELALHPGDVVTVADPSGAEVYRYQPATIGDGWADSISGDTALVSVQHSPSAGSSLALESLSRPGVRVDQVTRGFTAAESAARSGQRAESICGGSDDSRNAVCYRSTQPIAYGRSKAVARLLINGAELCTTWRVGPNNRLLTNNHCLATTEEVQSAEVWFDYACVQCDGPETPRTVKTRGNRLLATDATLDFSLFTVDDFAGIERFGFLELDERQPQPGDEVYIPQHPKGVPTVIAMADPQEATGNCAVSDPRYDGYAPDTDVSYLCDTDGGSSGSPVISRRSNKVIALHHFGGCPNSGVRIDLISARIAAML